MKVFYDGVNRNVFFSEIENRWIERKEAVTILIKEVDIDTFDVEIDTEFDVSFLPGHEIKHIEVIDHKDADTTTYIRLKIVFDESVSQSPKEELIKSCIKQSQE
jgi:sulfite reductase beta subunit-like hemoprotein